MKIPNKFPLILVLLTVILISGCSQTGKVITEPTTAQSKDVAVSEKLIVNQLTVFVSKVIDGDTIELEDKVRVRLLGINTPEREQPYYQEATNRLKELVEGKNVVLESDVVDKDKYNRLLRHIYVGDVFVNLQLVKEGYATVYIVQPNTQHEAAMRDAENEAKTQRLNLWEQPAGENVCDNRCIGVSYTHPNAEGDDRNNLNDEYMEFKNTCSHSCDFTNWTIKDDANHIYTFPSFVLEKEQTVTVYTGSGTNTKTNLYWGRPTAVWNNDKDTLYLRNSDGELVLNYPYTGSAK
ncbi:MAG TPA: thermonuclease family protein [archaeon]|nr:thermonuclease family protein [archaeon]